MYTYHQFDSDKIIFFHAAGAIFWGAHFAKSPFKFSNSLYILRYSSSMHTLSFKLTSTKFVNDSNSCGSITRNLLFCSQMRFIFRLRSNKPMVTDSNSLEFSKTSCKSGISWNNDAGNSCNLFCDKMSIWSLVKPRKAFLSIVSMPLALKLNQFSCSAPVNVDAFNCRSSFVSKFKFFNVSAPAKSPFRKLRNWQFCKLKSMSCGNVTNVPLGKYWSRRWRLPLKEISFKSLSFFPLWCFPTKVAGKSLSLSIRPFVIWHG